MNQLSRSELPEHAHKAEFIPITGGGDALKASVTVNANSGNGNQDGAGGGYWATGQESSGLSKPDVKNGYSNSSNTTMAADAVEVTISGSPEGVTGGTVVVELEGGGQPFSIVQPILGMNYIICMEGLFPGRN